MEKAFAIAIFVACECRSCSGNEVELLKGIFLFLGSLWRVNVWGDVGRQHRSPPESGDATSDGDANLFYFKNNIVTIKNYM